MADIRIEELLELETEVWGALVDGDAAADARMLSEDFLGVYPSGFADRSGHIAQLIDGPTVAAFELTEPRAVDVSDSAVILSYRAVFRRTSTAAARDPEVMYVSSLWCRRGDRWVNVFSQDTPAASSPNS